LPNNEMENIWWPLYGHFTLIRMSNSTELCFSSTWRTWSIDVC